jgi:hypothetical protein
MGSFQERKNEKTMRRENAARNALSGWRDLE